MRHKTLNYSEEQTSLENDNRDEKYHSTGESEFSRVLSTPFDENEVLSERFISFKGHGPKKYRRPDERIFEDVCYTLWKDPEVDASEVLVSVHDGTVILKGSVRNRAAKKRAQSLVEHLPGVVDLVNELRWERPKYGLIDNHTGLI